MSLGKFGVAICTLNQFCLDFEGNRNRILKSIERSIELGASIRLGPELEVTGYGCEDAFYELDTVYHCWQIVGDILKQNYKNILINIGMPVVKDSALYNCVVVILNSKLVMIRPKTRLAIAGNYRENRWFTAWKRGSMSWFGLPEQINKITYQTRVPFGDGSVLDIPLRRCSNLDINSSLTTIRIGYELCEELWQWDSPSSCLFGESGCHLVLNPSGSYWELRKLDTAILHCRSATVKSGGVYAYANCLGCDGGGRLCYYGRSFVMHSGELVAMTTQTTDNLFDEVEVKVAFIDPGSIQHYRQQKKIDIKSFNHIGNSLQFISDSPYMSLDDNLEDISNVRTIVIEWFDVLSKKSPVTSSTIITDSVRLTSDQEIQRYCCLWLWDYLRRVIATGSGIKGFIVPLSGGLDSCSVVCIVYCLCQLLHRQLFERENRTISDQLKPIFSEQEFEDIFERKQTNLTPQLLCNRLLRCCYLQTRFSGRDSLERAQNLAQLIGAEFVQHNFDSIYQSFLDSVPLRVHGASGPDEVTLQQQNVQARLRMVLTYYMSQCNRLVLATGNVDEALVGYLTKYDCSSADLNPIGSISKTDLKQFVVFCRDHIINNSDPILTKIIDAVPSAELTGEEQKDEDDLGLTYDELSLFGRYRRGEFGVYGPFGMFSKLWDERLSDQVKPVFARYCSDDSTANLDPNLLATKVKRFFTLYGRNRHKQTILTPALHTETYSPDDNRFDHRQFLFNTRWPWQFEQIDRLVAEIVVESKPK